MVWGPQGWLVGHIYLKKSVQKWERNNCLKFYNHNSQKKVAKWQLSIKRYDLFTIWTLFWFESLPFSFSNCVGSALFLSAKTCWCFSWTAAPHCEGGNSPGSIFAKFIKGGPSGHWSSQPTEVTIFWISTICSSLCWSFFSTEVYWLSFLYQCSPYL